jgi:hypothetical protein
VMPARPPLKHVCLTPLLSSLSLQYATIMTPTASSSKHPIPTTGISGVKGKADAALLYA